MSLTLGQSALSRNAHSKGCESEAMCNPRWCLSWFRRISLDISSRGLLHDLSYVRPAIGSSDVLESVDSEEAAIWGPCSMTWDFVCEDSV